MARRRVVVTGLGAITPLGLNVKETWENILAGRSGIGPITRYDASEMSVRIAGEVKAFNPEDYLDKKEIKKMDPFIHYGIAAAIEALEDAGIEAQPENPDRIGVVVGSGIGGLLGIEKNHDAYLGGGARKISPFFIPGCIINMVAGNISIRFGFQGPNYSIVSACTTGTHNIGDAARLIGYGDADVMVAGGTEMGVTILGVGGFAASRALSTRNDDPQAASRPWDVDRDGFVLGEGAAVLVLEELEHARRRGAKIYAELTGYGMSADASHMTQPSEDGRGACACMEHALKDAKLDPSQIDYINAHGTSTPLGDRAESSAIQRTFGDHANRLAVSSTKSMIGHLLGAAGGVEALFSVLAIRDQVAPPTINLDNQDPACPLDFVPHTAREMKIDAALTNSFGFGGTNGTLIFQRLD